MIIQINIRVAFLCEIALNYFGKFFSTVKVIIRKGIIQKVVGINTIVIIVLNQLRKLIC